MGGVDEQYDDATLILDALITIRADVKRVIRLLEDEDEEETEDEDDA